MSDTEKRLTEEQVNEISEALELNKGVNTKVLNDVMEKEIPEEERKLVKGEINFEVNPNTGLGNPVVADGSVEFDKDLTLDELANMNSFEYKDYEVTEDMVKKSDIASDLSEEEVYEIYNLVMRYQSGEKFNIYNEMPKFMKKEVDNMFIASGRSMTKKEISKFVMDNLIHEIKLDQAFIDLNETIRNELALPSMTEMYSEFMKETFEKSLIEVSEKIKDKDPEKAKLLRDVSEVYSKTYTFEELIEGLNNRKVRQFIKDTSKYKKLCNSFNGKYIDSRFKITNIDVCRQTLMNCAPEIGEEYIKKFIMLICKVCERKDPNDILDHTFMYYTVQNIRLLEHDQFEGDVLTDKRSDMYNMVIENIKKVVEEIKKKENENRKK